MKTLDELREEMTESGLDAYFDALAPFAKNALQVTLDVQDDDDLPVGISKFDGCPDLPAGVELECEYVSNRIYCGNPGGYKIAKPKGLDKNAARWNMLMQVDSNEDIGMMWGDMGRLYLWITNK